MLRSLMVYGTMMRLLSVHLPVQPSCYAGVGLPLFLLMATTPTWFDNICMCCLAKQLHIVLPSYCSLSLIEFLVQPRRCGERSRSSGSLKPGVSKSALLGLISQLWENILTLVHYKNGFWGSGIFLLSKAIRPIQACVFYQLHDDESACNKNIHHVICTAVGTRLVLAYSSGQMRHYFCNVLEVSKPLSWTRRKRKVWIKGEVITSMRLLEFLEKD